MRYRQNKRRSNQKFRNRNGKTSRINISSPRRGGTRL